MERLRILSGGAAQGLVGELEPAIAKLHAPGVGGTFGAVGAMRDKLLGGEPCDVVILTATLIAELEAQGQVRSGSARPLGRVRTGVAVKAGEQPPPMGDRAALSAALASARGIYFPDPVKATAGIHFMKVLRALGLDERLADRLRTYPNGAAAMQAMAASNEPAVVGCTQVTEILYTNGVQLVGVLPKEFELATTYTAAVCTRAAQPAAAAALVNLLASDGVAAVRAAGGFEPA